MEMRRSLKYGIFLPPFHPLDEDPTLAIRRDLDLIQWLDHLGYHEVWVGEHHSTGWELTSSPELLIAAAAERTFQIRLGTGVISLPYHNPLTVAGRIVQLDHQTRGRAMFGFGPGLLAADATMMGIPVAEQRSRMVEALEVILRLLNGEVVSMETSWFKLQGARLQLSPFSNPRPTIAVANAVSPSGAILAGRLGLGLLCVAATNGEGYKNLASNWQIAGETATANGHIMQRSELRLVGPMHIAETREKAIANISFGFEKWRDFYNSVNPLGAQVQSVEEMIAAGDVVVGTPDDALQQLERLWEKTGEFGTFLHLAHNWADFEATKKSYELFARYTMPKFERRNLSRAASLAYVRENAAEFLKKTKAAIRHEQDQHARSRSEASAKHGG
jgi:limonene 1,2-monooxygenase